MQVFTGTETILRPRSLHGLSRALVYNMVKGSATDLSGSLRFKASVSKLPSKASSST